ncbi:MAG: glycosyltransferase [Candidatus Pacearchaeota archaeon]
MNEKDICLVIPTYNRSEDIDRTLSTIIKNKNSFGEIIIVDQSKDSKTKDIVSRYSKYLPIKYIFSSQPSSSIAENIGVKEGKKKHKLIAISGDDVDFLPGYTKEMVNIFNKNPKIIGVGGIDTKSMTAKPTFKNKLASIAMSLFFLPAKGINKFTITGPYGCNGSYFVDEDVKDAEWIPGFNNCFRREVYENYSFPEIKGYNVLEDIDCSYTIYRKYGPGSLLITPRCKVVHRESPKARYPEKKRIFANHEDHFYFYYRHFNNFIGTIKMIWALFGIMLGNSLRFLVKPNKGTFSSLKYNIQGIIYSYRNRDLIKKGKLRKFLDDNLAMKKEYA